MIKNLRLFSFPILALLLIVFLAGCGGDNDGGGVSGTGTISGSVSGTTIIAVNDSGDIVASDDTAGKTADANGHLPFTLDAIPTSINVRVYLVTGGGVFPVYFDGDNNGSPETNVFSLFGATSIDLGFVNTVGQGGRAIPQNNPVSIESVNASAENTTTPPSFNASTNDFVGTWQGNIAFVAEDGESVSFTSTLSLSPIEDSLTGTIAFGADDPVNISGTQTSGVLVFDQPVSPSEKNDPDCVQWKVSVVATISAGLNSLHINGGGTFCGPGGGKKGTYTGTLTKVTS